MRRLGVGVALAALVLLALIAWRADKPSVVPKIAFIQGTLTSTPIPTNTLTPSSTATATAVVTATDTPVPTGRYEIVTIDGSGGSDAPAAAVATSTATPTRSERFETSVGNGEKRVRRVVVSLLTLVGTILGLAVLVPVAAAIAFRLVRLVWSRPEQLVVDTLTNATGESALDPMMLGLTQLAREHLRDHLERTQRRLDTLRPGVNPSTVPLVEKGTLPAGALDKRLDDLVDALSGVAPPQIKSALQLVGLVFPPRGTKVSGSLQLRGTAPGLLGITFEVSTLSGGAAAPFTLWERSPRSTPDGQNVSNGSAARTPKQAALLAELGAIMDAVGRYREAMGCYEEASQAHDGKRYMPAVQEARRRLERHLDGTASFQNGEEFERAGLVALAIERYLDAPDTLSGTMRDSVESSWVIVTGSAPNVQKATAYLNLASFYGHERNRIPAVADALYRKAIARGSNTAWRALHGRQQAVAAALVEAADRLRRLDNDTEAAALLNQALELVPGHVDATKAKAALSTPPAKEDDADVTAHLALGKLYEKSGDLAGAREEYVAAVTKQPGALATRESLEHLLGREDGQGTLTERYMPLVDAAARQLTLELLARRLSRVSVPQRSLPQRLFQPSTTTRDQDKQRYRARIENFLGAMYQASAPSFPGLRLGFLDRAIRRFDEAHRLAEDWYKPSENLADTYCQKGRRIGPTDVAKGHRLYQDASAWYALAAVALELPSQDVYLFEEAHEAHLDKDELKKQTADRITVGRETAKLLEAFLDTPAPIAHDEATIVRIAGEVGWAADRTTPARLIYNVACWYGIRLSSAGTLAHDAGRASYYLAHGLVRYEEWPIGVDTDPDLNALRSWPAPPSSDPLASAQPAIDDQPRYDIASFKRALDLFTSTPEGRQLRQQSGRPFSEGVRAVARSAGWSHSDWLALPPLE